MSTVDLYTTLDALWETFQENHRKHIKKLVTDYRKASVEECKK